MNFPAISKAEAARNRPCVITYARRTELKDHPPSQEILSRFKTLIEILPLFFGRIFPDKAIQYSSPPCVLSHQNSSRIYGLMLKLFRNTCVTVEIRNRYLLKTLVQQPHRLEDGLAWPGSPFRQSEPGGQSRSRTRAANENRNQPITYSVMTTTGEI